MTCTTFFVFTQNFISSWSDFIYCLTSLFTTHFFCHFICEYGIYFEKKFLQMRFWDFFLCKNLGPLVQINWLIQYSIVILLSLLKPLIFSLYFNNFIFSYDTQGGICSERKYDFQNVGLQLFGYFASLILATHILPSLLRLTVHLVFICFFFGILCVWSIISHSIFSKNQSPQSQFSKDNSCFPHIKY